MSETRRHIGITFAGGGNRAFYQIGLMEKWADALWPRVGAVAGVSAGAAAATLILSGRLSEAKAFFADQRVGVRGLFSAERLRRGERPFPHDAIYRATLRHAFADGGFERVRGAPFPIRILCTAFPERLPKTLSVAVGVTIYQLEKKLLPNQIHPSLPKRLGFVPRHWDARDCETVDQLVELIISSSSTPPFTTVGRFDGALIDGSMIDNAPAYLVDDVPGIERNIVLLTRPYDQKHVGHRGGRYYVAPRAQLPVTRWDYSEDAPVDETEDIGRREAALHLTEIRSLLSAR
jgi:predicted acylesterase/phospholipase RssA